MRANRIALLCTAALLLLAGSARAQTFVSAGVGGGGGGMIAHSGLAWQGELGGWVGDRVGIEVDFGYHAKVQGGGLGDNIRTFMGGVLIGHKLNEQWRVFGTAGVGLIGAAGQFSDIFSTSDETRNDFGMNVGGGVMGFFSRRFGARVDVRYFRELSGAEPGVTLPNYFVRFGAGLVLRF